MCADRSGSSGRRAFQKLRCFLPARQSPLRRELIDNLRQVLAESGQEIAARHASLPGQRVERVAAERGRQIIWRNRLVRPGADP